MVNTREALINVITKDKRQDAFTLGPKGTWSGPEAPSSSGAVVAPPAERRDLTHTVTAAERGKPVVFPAPYAKGVGESEPQGEPMGQRVKEEGESECRTVMGRIGVGPQGDITPRRKPADFPLVLAYVSREQTALRKQSRNVGGA